MYLLPHCHHFLVVEEPFYLLSFRLTSLKNTPFKCHDAVQIAPSLVLSCLIPS